MLPNGRSTCTVVVVRRKAKQPNTDVSLRSSKSRKGRPSVVYEIRILEMGMGPEMTENAVTKYSGMRTRDNGLKEKT
jgi:hypothetical protein